MIEKIQKVAKTAILQAGEIIRERIGHVSSSHIQTKAPFDYVTDVDRQSEALIMKAIHQHFPDHHIMSEETTNDGLQMGYTWIIDPLDGTTNFIHGFPFVAVSIGVYLDRKPLLGLVLDPLRDELFTARAGGGAELNGQPMHVREVHQVEDALVTTGFPHRTRHLLDPYLTTFRGIFGGVSGIRRSGAAALDLAYVAAGRVDGFWEAGLKAWDVAAGSLMVTEAGGLVNDFWEENNYLENGHIVAGVSLVYAFILEQVRRSLAPAIRSQGV